MLALAILPAHAAKPATFGAPTPFAAGGTSGHMAVGDFNRDGQPDLVVTNASAGTVSVLLATSLGIFSAPMPIQVGVQPFAVAVVDVDLDGALDIVVANFGSASLSVLRGDGAGGFRLLVPINPTLTANPIALAVGDFNRDGIPDLAVTFYDAGKVTIFAGDGAGGFSPSGDVTVGSHPTWIATGDFNRDGRLDLMVVNQGAVTATPAIQSTVSILLATSAGGFTVSTLTLPTGSGALLGAIADLNGDGKLDLVVANQALNTLSIFTGNGLGSFTLSPTALTTPAVPNVFVADLNGDGKPDLVVANVGAASLSVFVSDGTGGYDARADISLGFTPTFISAHDVDRDGRVDLLLPSAQGTNLHMMRNTTTRLSSIFFGSLPPVPTGVGPSGVAVGDVNGDGRPDVVVANTSSHNVSVFIATNALGGYNRTDYPTGQFPAHVVIGDVNGDGIPDLVVGRGTGGAAAVVVLRGQATQGQPNGTFAAASTVYTSTGFITSLKLEDMNRDGKPDLVIMDYGFLVIARNDGAGGFPVGSRAEIFIDSAVSQIEIADINRDGKIDIVMAHVDTKTVEVLFGDGSGGILLDESGTMLRTVISVASGVNTIAVADLDRDGALDLVVLDQPDDGPPCLTGVCPLPRPRSNRAIVFRGDGEGNFAQIGTVDLTTGSAPSRQSDLIVADFDVDGIPDLVVLNSGFDYLCCPAPPAVAALTVVLGQGNGSFGGKTVLAIPGGTLSAGGALFADDVNGDGRIDLVMTRMAFGANGNFTVLLNTDPNALPGSFKFGGAINGSNQYLTSEPTGSATVTIVRTGGSAAGATVRFKTSNGTATAPADYTAVNVVLTFAEGEVSKNVTIPIVSDLVAEFDETVNLALSEPGGGATLDTPITAQLVIQEPRISGLIPTVGATPGVVNLQVQGTGFTASSLVLWNSAQRVTTFAGLSTRLDADINFADLAAMGTIAGVTVFTPIPQIGGSLSNIFPFSIVTLEPTSAPANQEFSLTVRAPQGGVQFENINEQSKISFNDQVQDSTNFVSQTELNASIPAQPNGVYLVTVPRRFASGEISPNTAQPSGAIFTVGTGGNSAPSLTFTGESGYSTDGVEPNSGTASTTFTFRVRYVDPDGNPPFTDYPRVHIRRSGTPIAGSPFPMTLASSFSSGVFFSGAIYSKSMTLPDGTYTYQFEARDSNNAVATGAPTASQNGPFVGGNAPVLAFTGETGYTAEGIQPNAGQTTTAFVFRIRYTDADGDAPQANSPKVHVLRAGVPVAGSPFAMALVSANAWDGIYSVTRTFATAGVHSYRFEAFDATGAAATGVTGTFHNLAVTAPLVFSFSDDPLMAGSTMIKARHITELRDAINAARAAIGLPAVAWAEAIAPGVMVKRSHLTEMRTAIEGAYDAERLALPTWSTIPAGVTPVLASHLAELRAAIRTLP